MSELSATVYSEALPPVTGDVRAQLVVVEGRDRGRGVRVGADEVVVGTQAGCDLVLTDVRVSGRHMAVREDGPGRFTARDLGSRNGILYQGSVISEAVVGLGATFKLGHSFVRIQPLVRPLEVAPSQARRFGDLVAEGLAMRELFAVLELAAGSDATVLIEGETGTGKELCARAIHDAGARRQGPFVAVDCGALPEGLIESELMGHVRGAFTGATSQRAGAFARAHGGTIFLDELGCVPAPVQARLLRVIEERAVRAVGADRERPVDVRIVAASPDDLDTRVAEGSFRADLFYRLSVIRVHLPPLRARREDIPALVTELMRRRGLEPGPIAGSNLDLLMAHDWPGNVRELRNVIDRAVALSPGSEGFAGLRVSVGPGSGDDDPLPVRSDLGYVAAKEALVSAFERRYLRDVMARCEGNLSAAARASGLDRKRLRALLRKHGLRS
ncbi:sigma 54-interacting transcriptional regulator [Haliangium sp.]|uniref:sigma 54-interacting transcriptional regulator n=1 Tax=Haliangium sp. TaxID=2663208 RepID=UPI003D11F7E8